MKGLLEFVCKVYGTHGQVRKEFKNERIMVNAVVMVRSKAMY